MPLLDTPHNVSYSPIRKASVLASLKHKCAKSQYISFIGASQNLILCQTVSVNVAVALSDTAVVAIILANVRKLDKPSYVYPVSESIMRQIISFRSKILKISENILRVPGHIRILAKRIILRHRQNFYNFSQLIDSRQFTSALSIFKCLIYDISNFSHINSMPCFYIYNSV